MKAFASIIFFLYGLIGLSQTITLTSPQGGDTLIGGQTYTITWTSTGSIPNVDLSYLRNGVIYSIQSSVPNTGTYSWTVPAGIVASSNGYIRIKNSSSAYYDQNDNPFQFLAAPKSITVLYPNSTADTLQSGSANTITWSSTGTVSQVRILYSLNGGQSFSYASFGTSNTGAYTWTPSNHLNSSQLIIKVQDKFDQTVEDISDTTAFLRIGNTLTINQPQPSNLIIGSTSNISWTSTGTPIPLVDLAYSKDWGPWTSIASGIANTGSYNWTVPNDSSTNIRLQIKDAANPSISQIVYGYSISAVPQTLTLLNPNGGEILTEGDSFSIQWNHSNNLNGLGLQVLVDYSLDSGITWQNSGDWSIDDGAFPWIVPLHKISNTCLVKVHIIGLPGIADTSDAIFSIIYGPRAIEISQPNGGEKFAAEYFGGINYKTTGQVDSLDLYYSTNSGNSWTLFTSGLSSQLFSNSFTWPDIQSSNVRLKLKEKNSSLSDSSDADFTVSKLFLTQPYRNSSHFKDQSSNIVWNKSMSTGDTVSLYYSVDSGYSWILIGDSIPNSGSYAWLIPDENSEYCRIKIVDNSNPIYRDSTSYNFKIYPSRFAIVFPNGGEYLDAQTNYSITWNTNSYLSRVNLDYSTDNGSTWSSIGSYISNVGSYSWTSPNITTSDARIRVSNYWDNTDFDISDSTFNIGLVPPKSISLLAPNGTENYLPGSVQNINWTSLGAIDSVDIYYSSDNGSNWNLIAAGELNDSTYSWTIPNTLSSDYLVYVRELGNPLIADTSDANFEVSNLLLINYPNGGESFYAGNSYSISWNQTGVFGQLDLSYSTDSGQTWTLISSNVTGTNFSWLVPSTLSDDVLVRISDGQSSDESDQVFSILPQPSNSNLVAKFYFDEGDVNDDLGNLQGERYNTKLTNDRFGCKNHAIFFENQNQAFVNFGDVLDTIFATPDTSFAFSFWLSRAGGGNSGIILSKNSDSNCGENGRQFSLNITSTGKLQFVSHYSLGLGNYDISQTSGNIATSGWHHVVLNYDGSVQSNAQDRLEIYIDDVLQSLSSAGSAGLLGDIQNGPASFGFGSQIKSDSTSCGNLYFEGSLDDMNFYSGNLTSTEVNTLFTETKTCPSSWLSLTLPSANSIYSPGDMVNIDWNTTGTIAQVDLYYSLDGGFTFHNIVSNLANTGNYLWTVPHGNSNHCLIRIVDSSDPLIFDENNNYFIVELKSLDLIHPNLGQNLNGLSNSYIRWNSTGNIQGVDIFLSIDSGATWTNFASGVSNNVGSLYASHYYTVPNIHAPHCFFAVVDTANPLVSDTVDQSFAIQFISSGITVINPNGGEKLISGTSKTILWNHQGSVNAVNLSYSVDSGNTFLPIANNELNDGNYSWLVPNVSSRNCLIRIEDTAAGNGVDTSDAIFSISPVHQLDISYPNGGELIEAYAWDSISWNSTGLISMVDIYFSRNNGLAWQLVEDSVANSGFYQWFTPAFNSTDCLIRIVETEGNTISDTSNAIFELGPVAAVELLYPNGGEVFTGGTQDSVLWDGNGNMNVNNSAYFSSDSGQTWVWVGDDMMNRERLFWNIPNINSTLCLIAFAGDTSDATFTIIRDDVSLREGEINQIPELFPNPILRGEKIHFSQIHQINTVEIHDNLGRLVITSRDPDDIKLDKLDAGIYHVRIYTNKDSYLQRLIIR